MATDKITALAAMVERGIERCDAELFRMLQREPHGYAEQARRCDRLAELYERQARWWRVLTAPTYRRVNGIPRAYGIALHAARGAAERYAQDYRAHAERYRELAARAAGTAVAA